MDFRRTGFTDEQLKDLYSQLLYPRLVEEKMLLLLRQGKVSKWFSGIGQEAISVGCAYALRENEWIMPLHRNLGVFTTRGMPLEKLYRQWQGDADGYSKGRERSFHFGSADHFVCGMISHLGPQLSVACGTALASKLRKENRVSLAFTGEGGTSEGEFHEALNVAAVWGLPVIFVIENNGYGLSTPVSEQYKCANLVDRARGYGMESIQIDGNNVLTVADTIRGVRDYCLSEQKPYLIECMTFRMRGHEEASGVKYVPPHLFREWQEKDPLVNYEAFLLHEGIVDGRWLENLRGQMKSGIEDAIAKAERAVPLPVGAREQLNDVYAHVSPGEAVSAASIPDRLIDSVKLALTDAMEEHSNLVLMGQDIAGYGGAFKATEGLMARFGAGRVRNTPLCESAILGIALGMSLEGYKSMVEMQFSDFVSAGFTQIVNNLAKAHYRWGATADVVVRMPTGAGVGAGPFHSQSTEAWFTHVPGLKVVYPSNPSDAYYLLLESFRDPNPVMFFEHKALYRRPMPAILSGPRDPAVIGRAQVVREGADASVITYGLGVHWALDYADRYPDVSLEILDLRTLAPLDYDAIRATVEKTGKVLVLHEDTLTGGFGGEIAAWIGEHCFSHLDAPVMRCASLDTPVPFNKELEEQFLAIKRLESALHTLVNY